MDESHRPYFNILVDALRRIHDMYPDRQVEIHIKETADGWQCLSEFADGDAIRRTEGFFIWKCRYA